MKSGTLLLDAAQVFACPAIKIADLGNDLPTFSR